MSSERKNTGLRVALASYDVHQLRVWHQYIVEQSAEILCSEYRSGEELLQSLKQGRNTEVVVLGGPLEDMDSREFLERMSRLPQKPLLLLQDNARRDGTGSSSSAIRSIISLRVRSSRAVCSSISASACRVGASPLSRRCICRYSRFWSTSPIA